MHTLNALIAVLLLLFSANAFGFACAGVNDFSQSIELSSTADATELSLLSEIKNGIVLETDGETLEKFSESVPIALRIESEAKGKIYYALASTDSFYSDYPTNYFAWVDGRGASFLDGAKKSFKPDDCTGWETATDALMLDLSDFEEDFSIFTASAVPRNSFFTLLCAPSDVTLSIQYFDGTKKAYDLGKGIFNGGGQAMVPLGFYSRYETQEFPGENFPSSVIEKISEEKACVFDFEGKKAVYWNLAGMLERIEDSTTEPEPVDPVEEINPVPAPEPEPPEPEPVIPEPATPDPDSDGDGIPDNNDPEPNIPETREEPIPVPISNAAFTIYIFPAKWSNSLGSYEAAAKRNVDFFLQNSGASSRIDYRIMTQREVADCGFDSLNYDCLNPSNMAQLLLRCVRAKLGTSTRARANQYAVLTNYPNFKKLQSNGQCRLVGGYGQLGGNISFISMGSKAALAHELGHSMFYFCEQYSARIHASLDAQLRASRTPANNPGCQNKYPGPGDRVRYHAMPRNSGFDLYSAIRNSAGEIVLQPSGTIPSCPAYEKCSYNTGNFVTCCPNDVRSASVDCSGRFIKIGSARGSSIMGPSYQLEGVEPPRSFDCFEQDTIARMT